MTARYAALLIVCVGLVGMVSTAVTLLLLRSMLILEVDPPVWAFALSFLTGCVLAFAVGLVASWATRLPGFVRSDRP